MNRQRPDLPQLRRRDVTDDPDAQARARAALADRADVLAALGFEPLLLVAWTLALDPLSRPVLAPDEAAALQARAEAGDVRAADRLAWCRDGRSPADPDETPSLSWWWVHLDTGDVACMEITREGADGFTVVRVLEDGTLVRTLRRPAHAPPRAPAVTGPYTQARLPGLYALYLRIAGDGYAHTHVVKPRLRHIDQVTRTEPIDVTWQRHLRWCRKHARDAPVAPPTPDVVQAAGLRSVHVTHAVCEEANRRADRWTTVAPGVAFLVVGALLGVHTGRLDVAVVGTPVLVLLAGLVWDALDGTGTPALAGGVAALVTGLVVAFDAPWLPVLYAVVACFLVLAASNVAHVWWMSRGRNHVARRLTEPAPVPAADLPRVYLGATGDTP